MSFFFALAYLIAEYMRPQQMYDFLSLFPLAQVSLLGMFISFFLEGRGFNNSNFQSVLLSAFLFWYFIAYWFAYDRDLALQPFIDFSKIVLIYLFLVNIIKDERKFYIFLFVFLLLNFKYSQHAVRIWASKGFYSDPRGLYEGGGIGAGFFKNPNDFGAALNSVFGISFYMIFYDLKKVLNRLRVRWFHVMTTLSLVLAVLATSSRGATIALGFSTLAIWFKSERKLISIAILILGAIIFVSLIPEDNWTRFQNMGEERDRTGNERLELWRAGIRMANENPFTGVGPNNFVHVNRNYYFSEKTVVQHNIFVQAASELGYPGLILYVLIIGGCFYNHRKVRKVLDPQKKEHSFLYGVSHGLDVGVIGFVTNGFFITVLYYPFFWMLLILSVALLEIARKLAENYEVMPAPVR